MPVVVPWDLELSRRRAEDREAVLIFLALVGVASLWQISEATGIRPSRVVGIMKGLPREYSVALSLIKLGAVRERVLRDATYYEVTALGRKAAEDAVDRLRALGVRLGAEV